MGIEKEINRKEKNRKTTTILKKKNSNLIL